MKQFSPILLFLLSSIFLNAQSTNLRVYDIFQNKCVSCHGTISPEAGLDLYGEGTTESARALSVRLSLVNQIPSNSAAAAGGYKLVSSGRADQSHLFRKINNGIESTIGLNETEEGTPCPKEGSEPLTDAEKELIRQWIFFGAPSNGEVVDADMINTYYTEGGLEAFPDGPPPAPAEGEGYQIKMGPFFLHPGEEVEYFQKWQLDTPEEEVDRIDVKIGTYSHHFLIYNFEGNGANGIPQGYRLFPNHTNVNLVAAVQGSQDLHLPARTAWVWEEDMILDLNSHYINYDAMNIYKAEAYLNVYTDPLGTAEQEMHTELVVNSNIYIPNDGDLIIEEEVVNPNQGEIFVWSMTGHTHKYGVGYKIWERENGVTTDLIYDASCPNGVPGCNSPFYDYQHIPSLYFEDLHPLTLSSSKGFKHEARYINDGPEPVWFGATSDDEMMVMILMFTTDTTGLNVVSDVKDIKSELENVKVSPNPMTSQTYITLPSDAGDATFTMYDLVGKEVLFLESNNSSFLVERNGLVDGLYVYRIEAEDGRVKKGRIVLTE